MKAWVIEHKVKGRWVPVWDAYINPTRKAAVEERDEFCDLDDEPEDVRIACYERVEKSE